jgi:putative peptidoglycan lipid II flippase
MSETQKKPAEQRSLVKNAGVMGVAVLLSRILGLVREQVFAYIFGAGLYSDAALVAFRVPNLLRDLLAEGALSSSFVSVFSKEKTTPDKQELYKRVSHLLVWLLLAITLLICIGSAPLVELLAGAFHQIPGKFELTVELTRLLSPFLLFASLGALSMGLLNSLGVYFLPALGAAAFNLSSIFIGGLGAYFLIRSGFSMREATLVFSFGTLSGGFFSWAIQWRAQTKRSYPPLGGEMRDFFSLSAFMKAAKDKRIRRILSMIAPAIVTVGVLQVNIFVNTGLAAELQQGSVTWLNYAYRLLHFPMGIFGVSLFMAALPKLSELSSNPKEFAATLQEALGLCIFVSIGAAAGLYIFSEPLMATLFEHGRFGEFDVVQSSLALQAYALGLLAFNTNKILTSAFFAMENVWTPALLSLISIVANYIFSILLSKQFGHRGIALSVSLTSTITTVILMMFLRRRNVKISVTALTRILAGSLLALIPMLVFYYFGGPTYLTQLKRQSFIWGLSSVLFSVLLFGLSYFALSVPFLSQGRSIYRTVLRPKVQRFLSK